MLVSVVIPMFNAEATICETLNSILNQTYTNIEVLIVDDGSTDSSLKLVSEYSDKRVKVFTKVNGGVSSARNLGIKESRGDYIAFCDSDDVWKIDKLEKQIYYIEKNNDIDFIGCNRNGESIQVLFKKYNKFRKIDFFDMLLKMFPQTSTAVIKKTVFDDVGIYDESQKFAEDGNLWLRICKRKNCYMMPDDLVITGGGKPNFGFSGLSGNLKAMSDGVIKNINEMYELKYISFITRNLLIVLEKVKYFRRIVICKIRKG